MSVIENLTAQMTDDIKAIMIEEMRNSTDDLSIVELFQLIPKTLGRVFTAGPVPFSFLWLNVKLQYHFFIFPYTI